MRRVFVWLSLAALLTFPGVGRAQETAQDEAQGTFEAERSVTLVEVPVTVTAKDGKPVRDLPDEAFRLWDEGQRAQLQGIRQIDLGHRESAGAGAADGEDDIPSAARRRVLLLFDLSFAGPTAIVQARTAALDFVLRELLPGDLAGVATVSAERGVQLLVTFTSDRAQVARAIDTLGLTGEAGQYGQDPLQFIVEPPPPVPGGDDPGARGRFDQMLQEQLDLFRRQRGRVERNYERNRVESWSLSLEDLAGSLAGLGGPKQVLLFSEGFDSRLVFGRDDSRDAMGARADQSRREGGAMWMVDPDDTYGHSGLQTRLVSMSQTFRRAGVQMHAVDISALSSGAGAEGARPGAPPGGGGTDSLFFVADATGGELLRQADADGLSRLLHRSEVVYVLSYYPRDLPEDGSFRRLRVEVDAPRGSHVQHREGYYAPRPFAELDPLERSLLAAESLTTPTPRHELDAHWLATPFRAGGSYSYVPVIFEIGMDSLRATSVPVDANEEEIVGLEIFLYVSDAEGDMHDFVTRRINVRGAALYTRGVKFYASFHLAAGTYRLRALIRDARDGRTTALTRRLEAPDWSRHPAVLLPPFVVDESADGGETGWLMVRQRDQQGAGTDDDQTIYPFLIDGEPYVPSVHPALRPGETAKVVLVGYGLEDTDPESWTATVYGDDGVAHPDTVLRDLRLVPTRVERQSQLVGRLDPSTLRPGTYSLTLASPEGASASLGFRVIG